jgi:tRNA (cmo5U34)-methyltransferase
MQAVEYDRSIRAVVPGYEEILETIAWWVRGIAPPRARIVDLGGGTGALAEAVLEAMPGAGLELVDIDPRMLGVARARLARFGDRVEFREGSFTGPIAPCDAVVASLALHHIPDLGRKRELYGRVWEALRRPGIFLNGDCVLDRRGKTGEAMLVNWVRFMTSKGLDEAAARSRIREWEKEDTYVPLSDELAALAAAGFPRPECFWKRGPMAVYGGVKE